MIEAYKKFWINYVNFTDRTTVADYWYCVLANFIISLVLTLITSNVSGLGFLSVIFGLGSLIPGLANTVRRLHDTNKSWTYILMSLIPLAGAIILLVQLCQKSVVENNNYGVQL